MGCLPIDHQDLQSILEQASLRCTPQRLAVYDQLSRSTEHPTAEEVYQAVRSRLPKISLATVYKALEAWVAVGLATKLTADAGGNSARYDARRDLHYHFRCLRSGTVHDLPTRFDPDLITKLDPCLHQELTRRGFQVTGYRLELIGYQTDLAADAAHSEPIDFDRSVSGPAGSTSPPETMKP